ncbi:MAG: glutamate racemase [Bacilli bacterium]|nr:glutamate racemase [Bacilli bacterium]
MIGIFDSGLGGVTILKELIKILPRENYLYYADSLHSPYGDKTKEELEEYTSNIVEYLINKNCKIIIIACNTASLVCKEYLRKKYKIPIIATEPAYKMIYDHNRDSKTLIIATQGTVNSQNFQELVKKYDNKKTEICACSGLADLIEEQDSKKIVEYLKEKLTKYKDIESVVLGCTHYPLIKEEIKEVLGNVKFYDGGMGVSKQAKEILKKKNKLEENTGKITFVDSSQSEKKENLFFKLVNYSKI